MVIKTMNKMMKRYFQLKRPAIRFLGALLFIIGSLPTAASAAQAVATVSKNIVGVNEVFQLVVSVDANINTNSLDLSPLATYFTYGRPSVSSINSFNNGVVSRNTEWKVAIATKAIGEFTIPSFRIGSSTTEPITITSLKSSNASPAAKSTEPDIKVDAEIDKRQLYVGESLRYRVQIRIGEQMDQAALVAPLGDGLDIVQDGDDRQAETVLNGRRYIVITRYYQISATKAGTITLEGAQFKGSVVKGSRGFGSTLSVPVDKKTKDITLNIKGKPDDYQGLWLPTPELKIEQQWQPQQGSSQLNNIHVGEPITRVITLHIKNTAQSSMPNLALTYPSSVRMYDEKPVYSSNNGFTSMTVKQVIIPRKDGSLVLPELSINWWNTITGTQETSKVDGLSLTVLPGDNTNTVSTPMVPALPDSQPTAEAKPTEITVVTDSGWWPWLTATFASLWVITLLLWLRARKNVAPAVNASAKNTAISSDNYHRLVQAVTVNDALKVQTYYQQWAKHSLPNDLITKMDQEVANMMAAIYSKHNQEGDSGTVWNNTILLSLLQKARNHSAQSLQSSALEDLIPTKS
jgi:BatD DUF11 like domain